MKQLLANLTWLGVEGLTVPGAFIHDFLHVIETHRVRGAKLLVSGSSLCQGFHIVPWLKSGEPFLLFVGNNVWVPPSEKPCHEPKPTLLNNRLPNKGLALCGIKAGS